MEFVCRGMSTSFRRLVFRYCLSPMEEGSFSLRKGHKSRYGDDLLQMPSLTAVLVSILDNLYQGEALLKDGTYSIRPSPSSSLTLCQLRRKEKTQRKSQKSSGFHGATYPGLKNAVCGLLALRSPAQIRFAPKQKRTFKRFT